ncbi:hypothetical protein OAP76_06530 [Alphaproteobacteria bacterium]|nr:hypothetical protein [Alphaproteobacteria bacterium]
MKTLIVILVLFSSSLHAVKIVPPDDNMELPLHINSIFYVTEAFKIFDNMQDLSNIDMYHLNKVFDGLNKYGYSDWTINYIDDYLKKTNEQLEDHPLYLLNPLVVAHHLQKGFDYAYNFALEFEGYSKEYALSALFYQLYEEKNEVKMIFLIENHSEYLISSAYPEFKEYDITYEKSLLAEVLHEKNNLSGTFVLEEIKDIFFNIKLENMRPNHSSLLDTCIMYEDIECLKKYIEKEEEFLASDDHDFIFEYNISDILIALIKLEEFKLVDQYFTKFVKAQFIDRDDLQEIIELYPEVLKIFAKLINQDHEKLKIMFRITTLIKNYNTFDEEEKKSAYQELNDFIFNNKIIRDATYGSSDSEKINFIYFGFAMQAMKFNNKELGNLFANGGAINTSMMLEKMTWKSDMLESIVELLIQTENYSYAYEFTSHYELNNGLKNYIYSKMARAAARSGDLEWAINANKAWLFYKEAEPQIKKSWFKHEDDVVVYDKKLTVNLLINSSKAYLDSNYKDEVKEFINELTTSEFNSELYQWHSDEMEDFLEDLMNNNLIKESVQFSKWYLDNYKISDNPEYSNLNLEENRFDLVAKVFLGLLEKGELTTAFYILKYIELDESKKYSDIKDVEEKKERLLLQGAKILNDPDLFNNYLEYFSMEQKFNLTLKKISSINFW